MFRLVFKLFVVTVIFNSLSFANDDLSKDIDSYYGENYKQKIEFYTKSCDGGEVSGCNNLGIMHETSQGVRNDYSIAKKYYNKACGLGFQKACDYYKELSN